MPDDDATRVLPWRARPARVRAGSAFLSPAVRRGGARRAPPPRGLPGSGGAASITRADVRGAARTLAPAADVLEPFTAIRRTTAVHVARARATIPHGHVAVMCDYAAVESIRRARGLTYLPFVARAVVDALREFPR